MLFPHSAELKIHGNVHVTGRIVADLIFWPRAIQYTEEEEGKKRYIQTMLPATYSPVDAYLGLATSYSLGGIFPNPRNMSKKQKPCP